MGLNIARPGAVCINENSGVVLAYIGEFFSGFNTYAAAERIGPRVSILDNNGNKLANLGYQIDFFNDLDSGKEIDSKKNYKYSPQSGFRESKEGYDGRIITDIGNRNFSSEALKLSKEINRKAIDYYFEELKIKSRDFFR